MTISKTSYQAAAAVITLAVLYTMILSCGPGEANNSRPLSDWERQIIVRSDSVMYVLTLDNPSDSVILRTPCADFTIEELGKHPFQTLVEKMLLTVQSPEQGGVGIAGPQVGVSHRIVIVQRLDKEGEPFEAYPNAYIVGTEGEKEIGREGCLSLPGLRGQVPRYKKITLQYIDPTTLEQKTEVVEGFTAVIFQHEIDHLDGILYIDRAIEVTKDPVWQAELDSFAKAGKYVRPAWMDELPE